MKKYFNLHYLAKSLNLLEVKAGDVVKISGRRYTFGSVAASALGYNECPFAARNKSDSLGHDSHFAFQNAVVLSNPPTILPNVTECQFRDMIYFEGHIFELAASANGNVHLYNWDHIYTGQLETGK